MMMSLTGSLTVKRQRAAIHPHPKGWGLLSPCTQLDKLETTHYLGGYIEFVPKVEYIATDKDIEVPFALGIPRDTTITYLGEVRIE
jgi:hypothetical protein